MGITLMAWWSNKKLQTNKFKSIWAIQLQVAVENRTLWACPCVYAFVFIFMSDGDGCRFSSMWFRKIWIYILYGYIIMYINTLGPRQKGRHFVKDIFKLIFLNEKCCILIQISLKHVSNRPINNNRVFLQIMAWCRKGDRPISQTMMPCVLTHICVIRVSLSQYSFIQRIINETNVQFSGIKRIYRVILWPIQCCVKYVRVLFKRQCPVYARWLLSNTHHLHRAFIAEQNCAYIGGKL